MNGQPWELTSKEVGVCQLHSGEGFVDLEKLELKAQQKLAEYISKQLILKITLETNDHTKITYKVIPEQLWEGFFKEYWSKEND